MTLQDLLELISNHRPALLIYFAVPPALGLLLGLIPWNRHGPRTVWDYLYSILIYLVGIPGTISAVLIGYSMFFIRQNLLEVDFLIYFLPIISMLLTFWLIRRSVNLDRLPGFDRLTGLMMLIALSFGVVLALFKMRLVIGFFGSLEMLVVVGIVVFFLFRYASSQLFKSD